MRLDWKTWLPLSGAILIVIGCGLYDPRMALIAAGVFILIDTITWQNRGS